LPGIADLLVRLVFAAGLAVISEARLPRLEDSVEGSSVARDCSRFPAVAMNLASLCAALAGSVLDETRPESVRFAPLLAALFFLVDFVTVTFMIFSFSRTCPK
jgi:hypothetical protein